MQLYITILFVLILIYQITIMSIFSPTNVNFSNEDIWGLMENTYLNKSYMYHGFDSMLNTYCILADKTQNISSTAFSVSGGCYHPLLPSKSYTYSLYILGNFLVFALMIFIFVDMCYTKNFFNTVEIFILIFCTLFYNV
jgi:hypothetical protein